MADLSTTYLGLELKNPLLPSASPLSEDIDTIKRLEEAGASGLVMHSLFEEQITRESEELDHYLSYGTESFAEALSYFPEMDDYKVGEEEYLEHIRQAKEAVDIPIIASLNGVSKGGWTEYAKRMQQAGADAIELNIYYIPTDPAMDGREVEQMYLDVVRDVRKHTTKPIAVKLSPYFSAMANMAVKFTRAGADGLVLFNRFYQPDIDLETREVTPHLVLSSSYENRLPLRWIAILYDQVPTDFALTSGIHSHEDVLKGVMAGANVTMVASELLMNGIDRLTEITGILNDWMDEHEYDSIKQMRGSTSQANIAEPAAFERANYMKVLQSWKQDPAGKVV